MSIRALIVDDEPLARMRIRGLLDAQPDVQVAGECDTGTRAVRAIRDLRPDVVFLDVQMPGLDGFGVVERIGAQAMPVTVFVTAFDHFALRAFDSQALDYLLKPFEPARFEDTLSRVRRRLAAPRTRADEELAALLRGLAGKGAHLRRFIVRNGPQITFVEAGEVDWLQAEGNYVRLHVRGSTHLVRDTLAGVAARLNPAEFVRIHRSTVVNVGRVRKVISVAKGEYLVVLQDGTRLPSSPSHREELERALEIA